MICHGKGPCSMKYTIGKCCKEFVKINLKVYFKDNFGITLSSDHKTLAIQKQILTHIEGIIVGPTLVLLGMNGMFHKYFMQTKNVP